MMLSSNTQRRISTELVIISVVGLLLSYYAYSVEVAKEKDDSYEAMCDISEYMSCTKAFMSEYGKGFGLFSPNSPFYHPNPLYGLVFYSLTAILSTFDDYNITVTLLCLTIISNIGSIYLAYLLFLMRNICLVCISTYITNAIMLVLVVKKLRNLSALKAQDVKTE